MHPRYLGVPILLSAIRQGFNFLYPCVIVSYLQETLRGIILVAGVEHNRDIWVQFFQPSIIATAKEELQQIYTGALPSNHLLQDKYKIHHWYLLRQTIVGNRAK